MPNLPDPVQVAADLIRINTVNPPGNEEEAARYLGGLLEGFGLETAYPQLDENRAGLVATLKGASEGRALVYTGHIDTVPLGNAPWSFDPHAGIIEDGKLLGRGAADMKSGVAAAAVAAATLAGEPRGKGDLVFAFCASEETGSQGALQMAGSGLLPAGAGALLVAEPSDNRPFLGHKGALWLNCLAKGKSAHGSMPDLGDNAIYKAARAVGSLEDLFAEAPAHPKLGKPTVNVGTFIGGGKINMVPDLAEFQVDLRSVPGVDHDELFERVEQRLGADIELSRIIDLPGFINPGEDDWTRSVLAILESIQGKPPEVGYVNYFTDASILKPALGDPVTIILGPGSAGQAHQTDEFCQIDMIQEAAELYVAIGRQWLGL
jgi:succinyl-diaminopimelate desuccinylase